MSALKRKPAYDKNALDTAVHLVLQNKLSLRAASHLYKIPFSTLRTRKITVGNKMTNGSDPQNSDENSDEYIDQETINEEEQEEDSTGGNQDEPESEADSFENTEHNTEDEDFFLKKTVAEAKTSKPMTVHNLKSLKVNSLNSHLKTKKLRFGLSGLLGKSGGRVVKKQFVNNNGAKRLYIKHDKLDNLFANGNLDILQNNDKNIVQIMRENGGKCAKNNAHNFTNFKIISQMSKNEDESLKQVSIETRKYLVKTTSTRNDVSDMQLSGAHVFKCKNCRFLFLDVRMLNEHLLACQVDFNSKEESNRVSSMANEHPESKMTLSAYIDKQVHFPCAFCKQTYLSKQTLIAHIIACPKSNCLC